MLAEARRKWGEEIGMDFSLLVDEQLVDNFPWVMPCKDGHVSFAPFLLDHWWAAVVDMMGSPDWAVSEAFATTMGRVANADVVEPLTVAWLMQHTKQEIYEMALERKVACFPVNTMEEVLESRQYQARDFFVDVAHPVAGTLRQPGAAGAYSDTPWAVRRPVPLLGEHTTAVICGELPDGEIEGPQGTSQGREAPNIFATGVNQNMPNVPHYVSNLVIDGDGDKATMSSYLNLIDTKDGNKSVFPARYED